MENVSEVIEKLKPLFSQREAIDSQIAEILQGKGEVKREATGPRVKKKGRTTKVDHPRREEKEKRGFSEEEKNNIIELYRRGESTGSIAKLMKVPVGKMYQHIYQLKKQGLITDADRNHRGLSEQEEHESS